MSTIELSTIIEKLKEWEAIQAEAAAEVESLKDQVKAEMNARGVEELEVGQYIARFNPNRILLGNPGGTITFNRVERVVLYSGQFCGDTAYIFCKGSDSVYCIQFDRH